MNYFIGLLLGTESAFLLLDQRFYWRSMITIGIFFLYALNTFGYDRLRRKLPKNIFMVLILFIVYFYFNYDFFFVPEIYSLWGLTQKIYYLFSTPILIIIFLLVLGNKDNKNVFEFITSFSLTFAFFGFVLHIVDYHGTENENFLAVRFLTVIPLCLILFKSFISRLLILSLIGLILLYFGSRTMQIAFLFFILLFTLRHIIFSSKKIFVFINILACFVFSIFPVLYILVFQEGTLLTGLFLSEDKGVDGRFLIWAEIILRLNEAIIFGHGSNHDTVYTNSLYFGRNLSSHSMLLESIFRLGLVGYAIIISLLFLILNYCYERRNIFSIQLAWILTICSMFLGSLYEFIFFDGSGVLNNIIFWFTLATLLWVDEDEKERY
jgi:hypothetical protein